MKLSKEEIAKVIHEINKAYCESIGDHSQPDWRKASGDQKFSCRVAVNYHMKNDTTPEETHNNWIQDMRNNGWEWGPDKNENYKRHPYMVPFENLPREQQSKDYLAKAVVRTLMNIE